MSYYLPPGYQAEWTSGTLVLRRPDGSEVATFYGQRVIGEIIERYAWEDRYEQRGCRAERLCERFLQLPTPLVLGLLYLAGVAAIGLCAGMLCCLWLL